MHKEIFHGVPNHAIKSLVTFYRFRENDVARGRSIDRSFMAITLDSSCLHTSMVTTPEFQMLPPTFKYVLYKSHFSLYCVVLKKGKINFFK